MSEIVIFDGDARAVEVRLEGKTVWLTQKQNAHVQWMLSVFRTASI